MAIIIMYTMGFLNHEFHWIHIHIYRADKTKGMHVLNRLATHVIV
jgi:hypothetical protein